MASFKSPPNWAISFLQYICPPDMVEEVEGDLYEAFQWRVSEKGLLYARRKYIFEVLRCLRYFRIKVQTQNNSLMLIQNYFKTGFRFLWKTRGYSGLNILGLALGIAISWMAYIFVTDEYSYDAFYPNGDRIYRPTAAMIRPDVQHSFAGSSYIMGKEYPEQIPEIVRSSRFKSGFSLIRVNDEPQNESYHYADPDFFEMFSVDFVTGAPGTFDDPRSIVVSQSTAERFGFGTDIADAQITMISGPVERQYKVIGVYRDFPLNTSIRPEMIVPFTRWAQSNKRRTTVWFDINMNSFFELEKGTDPELVAQKMTDILLQNDDFGETEVKMGLQALAAMHLDPNFSNGNGIEARGDNELITIVIVIGIVCLVIACVNYANFAVGNYIVRLKEVAVRKVFGAEKGAVFKQFVTEAFISAFLALLLSIAFMALMLPGFSEYANKTYELNMILGQDVLLGGFILLVVTTLLAGIYPALLLSRYRTINGLKGKSKLGGRNYLSRGLIILQFSISAFLIAGMLTVNKQLNFMLKHDIGYSGDKVVRVFRPMIEPQIRDAFKSDLLKISGVETVSVASGYNGTTFRNDEGEIVEVGHARVDPDYIGTLNMQVLQGRNFDPKISTDYIGAAIVNEAFVKEHGLVNPIGQQINFEYGDFKKPTIIGVVKDFNFESLHSPVSPLVLYMGQTLREYDTFIKLTDINQQKMEEIEAIHSKHFAPYPLSYSFVDDDIARQYELEANIKMIASAGSLAAILLSCLGLMGFVGNQIRQKMKEVSIRKVVGAGSFQIFGLYLTKYIWLLVIGLIIGLGVAINVMTGWLANYSYKVDFGLSIGATAVIGVMLVAVLTILSQLYRAMRVNPVKYLKEE